MIWDTLDRVNKLRIQALQNKEFLDSAQAHADSLQAESKDQIHYSKRKSVKPKKLADIYEHTEFSTNPDGHHH